jgi:hypothetical protein
VPAVLLAVVVLSAIAVDLAVVRLAHRQAADAATAAADAGVTVGLDDEALRSDGRWRLDPVRTEAVAREVIADRQLPYDIRSVDVRAGPGPQELTVSIELWAPAVFSKALGDGGTLVRVDGTSTAVVR